jgi:hypothetical protein
MEISSSQLIIIINIIAILILYYYSYVIYCDNKRYKKIIDEYLDKPRSIIKKVKIQEP